MADQASPGEGEKVGAEQPAKSRNDLRQEERASQEEALSYRDKNLERIIAVNEREYKELFETRIANRMFARLTIIGFGGFLTLLGGLWWLGSYSIGFVKEDITRKIEIDVENRARAIQSDVDTRARAIQSDVDTRVTTLSERLPRDIDAAVASSLMNRPEMQETLKDRVAAEVNLAILNARTTILSDDIKGEITDQVRYKIVQDRSIEDVFASALAVRATDTSRDVGLRVMSLQLYSQFERDTGQVRDVFWRILDAADLSRDLELVSITLSQYPEYVGGPARGGREADRAATEAVLELLEKSAVLPEDPFADAGSSLVGDISRFIAGRSKAELQTIGGWLQNHATVPSAVNVAKALARSNDQEGIDQLLRLTSDSDGAAQRLGLQGLANVEHSREIEAARRRTIFAQLWAKYGGQSVADRQTAAFVPFLRAARSEGDWDWLSTQMLDESDVPEARRRSTILLTLWGERCDLEREGRTDGEASDVTKDQIVLWSINDTKTLTDDYRQKLLANLFRSESVSNDAIRTFLEKYPTLYAGALRSGPGRGMSGVSTTALQEALAADRRQASPYAWLASVLELKHGPSDAEFRAHVTLALTDSILGRGAWDGRDRARLVQTIGKQLELKDAAGKEAAGLLALELHRRLAAEGASDQAFIDLVEDSNLIADMQHTDSATLAVAYEGLTTVLPWIGKQPDDAVEVKIFEPATGGADVPVAIHDNVGWLKLQVTAGLLYSFRATSRSDDIRMTLFDDGVMRVLASSAGDNGVSWQSDKPRTLYLRIRRSAGGKATTESAITVAIAARLDFPQGTREAEPLRLAAGGELEFDMQKGEDGGVEDGWVEVVIPKDSLLLVETGGLDRIDTVLELRRAGVDEPLLRDDDSGPNYGARLQYIAPQDETLLVKVLPYDGDQIGRFIFRYSLTGLTFDRAAVGGIDKASAVPIEVDEVLDLGDIAREGVWFSATLAARTLYEADTNTMVAIETSSGSAAPIYGQKDGASEFLPGLAERRLFWSEEDREFYFLVMPLEPPHPGKSVLTLRAAGDQPAIALIDTEGGNIPDVTASVQGSGSGAVLYPENQALSFVFEAAGDGQVRMTLSSQQRGNIGAVHVVDSETAAAQTMAVEFDPYSAKFSWNSTAGRRYTVRTDVRDSDSPVFVNSDLADRIPQNGFQIGDQVVLRSYDGMDYPKLAGCTATFTSSWGVDEFDFSLAMVEVEEGGDGPNAWRTSEMDLASSLVSTQLDPCGSAELSVR